jgi:nitrite reductase/ring-hydroxylating ferredoxin subunit
MISSKIKHFYLIVLLLLTYSCEKTDPFQIPAVPINFTINVQSDVQYYGLRIAGNSMEISAQSVGVNTLGYDNNGVIVFNNGDEYYAFDRTCPHDFPQSVAIEGDNGSSATCPSCGSVYIFTVGGFPAAESPSQYPLKEYKTEYFPGGNLRVYN